MLLFLENMEKYNEALKNINIAIDLDNNHSYYYLKGIILEKIGKKSESQKIFRKGLQIALNRLNSKF